MRCRTIALLLGLFLGVIGRARGADANIGFEQGEGSIAITVGGERFATYVYRDPNLPRPYFRDVMAAGGVRVTRNHPPIAGKDAVDHPTMHPGIWLAFGDLAGADFWRNKAAVEHAGFVVQPQAKGGRGGFVVQNRYRDGERTICREECRYRVVAAPNARLLLMDSEFWADEGDFWFGDQEELGLGIRVATPMAVKNGGRLENSEGKVGEREVWGRQAKWCAYSGVVDGAPVQVLLMPSPTNFRPSWMHSRDYGFFAANPFGRNAFTGEEKSRVTVRRGERFRLGYGVVVSGGRGSAPLEPAAAAELYGRALTRDG